MIELSSDALRADIFPEKDGLFRQITHEPVGVVYVIVGTFVRSLDFLLIISFYIL